VLSIAFRGKNDTDVAHYNFNPHYPTLVNLEQMLLREYTVECLFDIPSSLTNVFALAEEA